MQKIVMSTLALSLVWLSCFPVPSEKSAYRAQFGRNMYARSGGLLNREEYDKLITSFLDEAEKKLKSVQYCEKNQNCAECRNYGDALLNYNVVCFLNYAQENGRAQSLLREKKIQLERGITALAKRGALEPDQIATEVKKTERIVLEGNKAFYSALPWVQKFALWWFK